LFVDKIWVKVEVYVIHTKKYGKVMTKDDQNLFPIGLFQANDIN